MAASPVSPEFLLSSSYDHSVKLWDMRCSSSPVMGFCHEFPVEGVLMFPSGGMCVSCGGQWVRVWELLAGGRSLVSLSNHQKTVMAVCFDSSGSRLLSAGLDKLVGVAASSCGGVSYVYLIFNWLSCTRVVHEVPKGEMERREVLVRAEFHRVKGLLVLAN